MNKLILAVLLAASQLTACGGGSSGGGGGNGVAAFPNNVGDTRNDGGFVFNNSTPCPIGVLPPPESCAYEQVDRMGVPAIATQHSTCRVTLPPLSTVSVVMLHRMVRVHTPCL